MGQIYVEGLGLVNIAGDAPTAAEQNAIAATLRSNPRPGAPKSDLNVTPTVSAPRRAGIPAITGGAVRKETFTAPLATASGIAGAGAGAPFGPVAATAGGIAGAALGAGVGSVIFDGADMVARYFRGEPQLPSMQDPLGPTKNALREMFNEGIASGLAAGLPGPKRVIAALTGAGKQETRGVAAAAERQGIPVGVVQASPDTGPKGMSRVINVFPFTGGPMRANVAETSAAVEKRYADILDEIAPNSTMTELGVDLSKAAGEEYGKFRSIAAALYENFEREAAALPEGAASIVPTSSVKEAAAKIRGAATKGTIKAGEGDLPRLASDLDDFLQQLAELPDRLTVEQYRGLTKDLGKRLAKAETAGEYIGNGIEIKRALERDLNALDVSQIDAAAGERIKSALKDANDFYASQSKIFDTATAKQFGRADKNIFDQGPFQAGTLNADELADRVFRAKSPQAMADLRDLVGDDTFLRASRRFMDQGFINAATTKKGSALTVDPAEWADRIGLTTPEGQAALEEMLKGTAVTLTDLDEFFRVISAAGSIVIPDTSIFLQRRLTLGGVKSLLPSVAAGAGAATGAVISPTTVVISILLARHAGDIMTDATYLKALIRAADNTVPDQQRRQLAVRLLRALLPDEEEPEQTGPESKIAK